MSTPLSPSALTTLRKRVARVSTDPGVYRWLDEHGTILYVGKAKNLRNRMKSYVQEGEKRSAWTEILVRQIRDFDVTVVRSELEALVLESNLIKELRPKFNIMLKDDKGYAYLRVSREVYPVVELVRRIADDGAQYLGPYLGMRGPSQSLDMLDHLLHFRACKASLQCLNDSTKEGKGMKACLDSQIGKCCGLCTHALSAEDYRERVQQVVRFFRGHFTGIKTIARDQMKAAALNQKFEQAAKLRDVIKFIEELEEKQVVSDTSGEHADIFGLVLRRGRVQVAILRERDGRVIEQLNLPLSGDAATVGEALAEFLPQFYSDTEDIPERVIIEEDFEASSTFTEWLAARRGASVTLVIPERGKKSALLALAIKNAEEKIESQFAAWEVETKKVEGALVELQRLLQLPAPPRRIEGYDISHLGGTATVGSMVVMLNGKPKRDHYRSFNIQTVRAGDIDDYLSLGEVLRRRLKYLTDDFIALRAHLDTSGIRLRKAKKAEEERIRSISLEHPREIGSDDVLYKDYIVAVRDDVIVGFCRRFLYKQRIPMIRSLWVHSDLRSQGIGRALVQYQLSMFTKGKVYIHVVNPDLLPWYEDLGFQKVHTPPDELNKKLDQRLIDHPGANSGFILVYIVADHRADPSFSDRPDLLLIDGGKGQIHAVHDVLRSMDLQIPIAGLAKREEEIFIPGAQHPLLVPEGSEARFLLQRLRDEAHRFANDRRKRRLDAALYHSKLDDVPGIGEVTKTALIKRFGSADAALQATDEELRTMLTMTQLHDLRKTFPRT